jgi:anti-sigma factor RsiW
MDCRRAEPNLSAWLDGELPPTTAAALEAHLGVCPACRRRRAELAAARHGFRQLAPRRSRLQASDVLARLAAESHSTPRSPGVQPNVRLGAPRWLPLAAAAGLMAVALWHAGSRAPARTAAPLRTAAAIGRSLAATPELDCSARNGADCRRLACFDADACGGAEEAWPSIRL